MRVGAVIFGLGTITYFALELVALLEFSSHPECFRQGPPYMTSKMPLFLMGIWDTLYFEFVTIRRTS